MALIRSLALGALCVLLPAALSAAAAGAWEAWRLEWPATDFSKRSVDLGEIVSGGPPRDGIPAIDAPVFAPLSELRGIAGIEPVVSVQAGGEARAYPLRILIWHEIVNDRVGGEALTVTFCPLCNTAIVFRRQMGERLLDFGTTGKLRHSDLVMYDRQTESWWQQFTGEAIAGAMTGAVLEPWPARLESLARFRQRFPEGRVLVPAAEVVAHRLAQLGLAGGIVQRIVGQLEGGAELQPVAAERGPFLCHVAIFAGGHGADLGRGREQSRRLGLDHLQMGVQPRLQIVGDRQLAHLAFGDGRGRRGQDGQHLDAPVAHHQLEGAAEQEIAHQHGGLVAPQGIGRRPTAPQRAVVHHVVVQQRRGVDELHRRRQIDMAPALIAHHARGGDGEHGAQALAARGQQMAGQLADQRHRAFQALSEGAVHPLEIGGGERPQPLEGAAGGSAGGLFG